MKDFTLSAQRTASGNLFHSAGAAAVKLRSPSVRRVFVVSGCSKSLLDDVRLCLNTAFEIVISLRYPSADK